VPVAQPNDVSELPTPCVVIRADVVRRNIRKLADYAASAGFAVRPHSKTHKLRPVAEMQLAAGAIGLAAAKVSEAEAISVAGEDVLLAYPPVDRIRAERVAKLAGDRNVRAALDSQAALEMISSAAAAAGTVVGLLVDLDVGLGRTGVQTPEEALALAQAVERAPHVRLDGIMIYPGHIGELPAEQSAGLQAVRALLDETLDLWQRHGLKAAIVSGGSTPTLYQSHEIPRVTELRPGTYVFNDMNTVHGGHCELEECAAGVVTTVVSDSVPGQVVLDSGSKTLARDLCYPALERGFGHVVEFPDARVIKLSEEHAQLDVRACESRPKVGDRVTVIPNHICPCVNLQEAVWWLEPGERPRRLRVDARGKLE